jgi:acyl-CoA synthetase (AMP-forming)/AMP-acid ligase II
MQLDANGSMPPPSDSGLLHDLLFQGQGSGRTALVSPESGAEYSYADLCRHSRALAALLRRRIGVLRPRIALLLPASAEFVVALFAVSRAGGVAIPLDTYTKPEELLAILRFLEPELVITNASLLRKMKGDGPPCCLVDLDSNALHATFSGDPNGAGPHAARVAECDPAAEPGQDALLILTSGTTGHPKAVRLSHRAVRRNIDMHLESLALEGEIVSLQVLPLSYSYGLIACLLSTLRLRGTAVLCPSGLEPKLIHALGERYSPNLLMGSPLVFQYLLEKGGEDQRALRTLRYLTVGGDRCRPHQVKLIRRCLPWARPHITYGLTEAGPRVSTLSPPHFGTMPQSVGRALPGVEIAILNPAGRSCPRGETGEVAVRTPSVMNGYFRDDARTAERLRDGWLLTGDFGRLDAAGFLTLLGRRDREFKFRGRRVHPGYIEQIIAAHPDVEEVHVAPAEGPQGEYIRATVKAQVASEEGLAQELRTLCRRHLPAFLVPSDVRVDDRPVYQFKGKTANQLGAAGEARPNPNE